MITIAVLDALQQDLRVWKRRLASMGGAEVIFATASLDSLQEISIDKLPDVLILDPSGQPHNVIRRVKKMLPGTPILVFTDEDDFMEVQGFFRSGAISYLPKRNESFFLNMAIETTIRGHSFISPEICSEMVDRMYQSQQNLNALNTRELQVAEGLMEGLSYKLIAYRLDLSLDTVRVYVKRIYRKLEINSKGELAHKISGLQPEYQYL